MYAVCNAISMNEGMYARVDTLTPYVGQMLCTLERRFLPDLPIYDRASIFFVLEGNCGVSLDCGKCL